MVRVVTPADPGGQGAMSPERPLNVFDLQKTDFRTNSLTPQVVIMQKTFNFRGCHSLIPRPGAVPLYAAGGSALDPRYRLALTVCLLPKLDLSVDPPVSE